MPKKTEKIVSILVTLIVSVALVLLSLSHGWVAVLMTIGVVAILVVNTIAFIRRDQWLADVVQWLMVLAFCLAGGYSLHISATAADMNTSINALYSSMFATAMALLLMWQTRQTTP